MSNRFMHKETTVFHNAWDVFLDQTSEALRGNPEDDTGLRAKEAYDRTFRRPSSSLLEICHITQNRARNEHDLVNSKGSFVLFCVGSSIYWRNFVGLDEVRLY